MATNTSVAITAGSGTPVDGIVLGNGDFVQATTERAASAATTTAWTVSTTPAVIITASPNNVAIKLYNASSSDVYVGLGATTVTASLYVFPLLAGMYWEAPPADTFLAVSLVGKVATGVVMYTVSTEV